MMECFNAYLLRRVPPYELADGAVQGQGNWHLLLTLQEIANQSRKWYVILQMVQSGESIV